MTERVSGSCHCGAVQVSVPQAPEHVLECHCTICRRYAALWAYYPKSEVTLTGETDTYVWGRRYITYHRCGACGCVMAWLPRGADYPECGVNARNLDGFDLSKVTLHVEEDSSV